ncbi:ABC transporter substrate-binding protein [Candidatus Eisenbacteria bacterium]|uniref:ABC transporter substrate-binding protein n=1 Tax=Eiseniibacteriota bacterium TaxID=2212470 RepID=A0ABV6YJJ8_UNCEI
MRALLKIFRSHALDAFQSGVLHLVVPLMFAWGLCAVPAVLAAAAPDVLIVLSGNQKQYRLSSDGMKAQLDSHGIRWESVLLNEFVAESNNLSEHRAKTFVAVGAQAAIWLQEKLPTETPLAYCMVPSPDDLGLTDRPRTYGVSTDVPIREQLEFIIAALPDINSIGLLYSSEEERSQALFGRLQDAIPTQWDLHAVCIDEYDSFAGALDALVDRRPDIIWTMADATVYDTARIRALLLHSLRAQIPVFGFSLPFVRAGAMLGIGVNPKALGTTCATMIEQVHQSGLEYLTTHHGNAVPSAHKPNTSFDTALNLYVAERFDLSIPRTVIDRATCAIRETGD